MVTEHSSPRSLCCGLPEKSIQPSSKENIVAEHERASLVADELLSDNKSLGQPLGSSLFGICQRDAPLRAITEQLLEKRKVMRRRDDQDISDASEHQGTQRIID